MCTSKKTLPYHEHGDQAHKKDHFCGLCSYVVGIELRLEAAHHFDQGQTPDEMSYVLMKVIRPDEGHSP
jgi:hypothetical protein